MKYAYIESGIAQDVVTGDPHQLFQPGYAALFVEVPDEVEMFWFLQDGNWYPPERMLEPVNPVPVVKPLTRLAMMGRFTDAELGAIYTAAKEDIAVEIWLDRFKMSEDIDPADERTIAGMQLLVDKGLVEQERLQELLLQEFVQ